ncbi:MAG: arginine--tRNA ligase [Erysipelotrichaceae bacterium]|nr:arginine--tRNA ligase [Erysipelotrichaceae bacterium]MCI9312483.1 arginine--tRNA ligase [Erysipelotrichaceae bacterium]
MSELEQLLKQVLADAYEKAFHESIDLNEIVIEIPKDQSHGDYASNLAMRFAKVLKQNPRQIAEALVAHMDQTAIEHCEIAGPGFVNFTMKKDVMANVIDTVLRQNEQYGHNESGAHRKVNLEYVSANPTGDLHLGHARGAAWGDSVARLMKASGYEVCREYYVNDAGNQIHNLALSLMARYAQELGEDRELPEDGYYGKDVIAIAKQLVAEHKDHYLHTSEEEAYQFFRQAGMQAELAKLKQDLASFRVAFDVWSSEQELHDSGKVEEALHALRNSGKTYEKDGAIWFRATDYGDDKDRVLKKSDGSYTYLMPDIAYHITKFERGFDTLINFWGADHHGYIPRMKAAMAALGQDSDQLKVDIIQMVRLVENGEEVKMSKRTGNAVTVRELCEEVGVDAVRYFFVQRALDTHLDFDLGLARRQSNDNPVYYAQYAHARICSILKQAGEWKRCESYELLTHEKEIALLKYINEFPAVVMDGAATRAPHKLCNYIQKLAAHFHSFYNACKVIDKQNEALSAQRLALLQATKITLKNALYLIGVEAKTNM